MEQNNNKWLYDVGILILVIAFIINAIIFYNTLQDNKGSKLYVICIDGTMEPANKSKLLVCNDTQINPIHGPKNEFNINFEEDK